jgi:glycerophosphoryl diester phosphodiesterase
VQPDFTIFAHRGASGIEPENTLASFRRAIECGARWIELDVHAKEGELIVFHDDRLDRRTDGTGRLEDRSLEYIRSLDAGDGERIPLLDEVFDLIAGRAGVNIELKGSRTADHAAAAVAKRLGRSGWDSSRFLVSSFDWEELARFKSLAPGIRIGGLASGAARDTLERAKLMGCYSLHLARHAARPDLLAEAHRLGLLVFVYTVNRTRDMARMRNAGADGIFTDRPELAVRFLEGGPPAGSRIVFTRWMGRLFSNRRRTGQSRPESIEGDNRP